MHLFLVRTLKYLYIHLTTETENSHLQFTVDSFHWGYFLPKKDAQPYDFRETNTMTNYNTLIHDMSITTSKPSTKTHKLTTKRHKLTIDTKL